MNDQPQLKTGADALARLEIAIERAFDDDATGEVWATRRTPGGRPEMVMIQDPAEIDLADGLAAYEMIVVDSGNAVGDEWKYVFHPRTGTGLMIVETVALGGGGSIDHMLTRPPQR